MTRTEILDLVDRWQTALNAHDVQTLVGLFADDAEFVTSFRIVDAGQAFRGKQAIRQFFADLLRRYPGLRAEVDTVIVDEEAGALAVEYRWGSPAEPGGNVDWVVTALVARVSNGRFSSFHFYRRT